MWTSAAFSQVNSTGTISGRVTDAQGNVVSGATVSIVEQQTNVETKLTTNGSGFYSDAREIGRGLKIY